MCASAPCNTALVKDLDVYHHGVDPVTAFVLAGGKSSRMGRDKAFLELEGRTLLSLALEAAHAVTASTWIVGSAAKFAAFGPVVEDVYSGRGPLAGIHAALSGSATNLNLILAVDLPFIQSGFLQYLISQARESPAVVVVPRTEEGLQPLCAVYRQPFADVAERSLRAGKNKIDSLFAEVTARIIPPEELEQNGFQQEMFRNLNTEQDWKAATRAKPFMIGQAARLKTED